MGLRDKNTRLADSQAFTSSGGVATDAYPLGATGKDIASGDPQAIVFTIEAVSAVAGTLQFQAVTATASDGTTGQAVLVTTPAITDTTLVVGDKICLPLPQGRIASTATHLTGKIVLASSGTCTATIDFVPLAAVENVKFYDAEPRFPA